MESKKLPFGIYFFFFLLLFLQFPLASSLPGKVDSWFYLTLFNDFDNILQSLWTGEVLGNAYFPEATMIYFGEPSFGSAAFFLPFKWLGFSDLWAFYIFIAIFYTLNAFCTYLLASLYFKNGFYSLFAGFIFASANFSFAHMDHQNTVAFFPALLSIYFFKRFIVSGKGNLLLFGMLAGGWQVYFSTYNYAFQSLILLIIGLFSFKTIWQHLMDNKKLLLYFSFYVLLIIPYLNIFIFSDLLAVSYNPAEEGNGIEMSNLKLVDFGRSLKNNLIYAPLQDIVDFPLLYHIRSANIGILIYLLAFLGLKELTKWKKELLVIFFGGLLIAIGPSMQIFGYYIPMPMKVFYDYLYLDSFIRTPARAFFVCLVPIAIFAAYGIRRIFEKYHIKPIWIFIPLLLFWIENIPIPFEKYNSYEYLNPSNKYLDYLKEKRGKIVANLPSGIFSQRNDFAKDLNEYQREHIYAFWQTKHKNYTLNGSNGYFPPARMDNNKWLHKIEEKDHLEQLINANGLNYISFHHKMQLEGENADQLDFLKTQTALLKIVAEDEMMTLFEVQTK